MPEGPSIVLLREAVACFEGKRIQKAAGNANIDFARLKGKTLAAFHSWGKHFLIELSKVSVRVHFLMFGSYTINTRKDRVPRLQLKFANGELNLYSCAIKLVEGPLTDSYDWAGDVMSDKWDAAAARRKLRAMPKSFICDALLDQDVFAGVGNIIKNEVLFRVRVHPLSQVGAMPPAKLRAVVTEARRYSFDFLGWRREGTLKKHWLVHNKVTCPACEKPLTRAWVGDSDRRSFFCEHCQSRHGPSRKPAGAQRTKPARTRKKRA